MFLHSLGASPEKGVATLHSVRKGSPTRLAWLRRHPLPPTRRPPRPPRRGACDGAQRRRRGARGPARLAGRHGVVHCLLLPLLLLPLARLPLRATPFLLLRALPQLWLRGARHRGRTAAVALRLAPARRRRRTSSSNCSSPALPRHALACLGAAVPPRAVGGRLGAAVSGRVARGGRPPLGGAVRGRRVCCGRVCRGGGSQLRLIQHNGHAVAVGGGAPPGLGEREGKPAASVA